MEFVPKVVVFSERILFLGGFDAVAFLKKDRPQQFLSNFARFADFVVQVIGSQSRKFPQIDFAIQRLNQMQLLVVFQRGLLELVDRDQFVETEVFV